MHVEEISWNNPQFSAKIWPVFHKKKQPSSGVVRSWDKCINSKCWVNLYFHTSSLRTLLFGRKFKQGVMFRGICCFTKSYQRNQDMYCLDDNSSFSFFWINYLVYSVNFSHSIYMTSRIKFFFTNKTCSPFQHLYVVPTLPVYIYHGWNDYQMYKL